MPDAAPRRVAIPPRMFAISLHAGEREQFLGYVASVVIALLYGLAASSALLIGAAVGTRWDPPRKVTGVLLAFASGALLLIGIFASTLPEALVGAVAMRQEKRSARESSGSGWRAAAGFFLSYVLAA